MQTDPSAAPLVLAGDLTLQGGGAARERLLQALAESPRLTLAIDPAAAVDLTLPQLIEAARRSAAAAGGEIALAQPAEGALLETLTRGGFLEGAAQRQFWLNTPETC